MINLLLKASLDQLQILNLIFLGFVDFLPWDDLSRPGHKDIIFHEHRMAIFLETRTKDQFREGSWFLLLPQAANTVLFFC